MAKKKTYEEIQAIFINLGYELISDTYINAHSKLVYMCKSHGRKEITYADISRNHGCDECGREKASVSRKVSIETVTNLFTSCGYTLLDKTYVDSYHKMRYNCPSHGEQFISYNKLKGGQRCNACSLERVSDLKRLSIEYVRKEFKDRGYTLISDKYTTNHDKLIYLCPVHGEQSIVYSSFKDGSGCPQCALDNNSGESHWQWKGGITDLSVYLRNSIVAQHHKDAIISQKYTCNITKTIGGQLEVHHTYAFGLILKDTLNRLNLDIRKSIGEYTVKELCDIKDTFEIIQSSHRSVVLSKHIHKLFHTIYGQCNGDNTPEQFYEFKERYDNGEFTEILTV